MSIFFVQQAAHFNSEGITALLEGQSNDAIAAFTRSAKLMKQALSQYVGTDSAHEPLAEDDTAFIEIPEREPSEADLFNKAITIPLGREETSDSDIHVYTAAVVYNLALVHHLKGIRGNAAFSHKAEKLYSIVLRLTDDNCICTRTSVLFKLGAINNLALIRTAKGEYDQAIHGLSQLNSFLQQASSEDLLKEPEIKGLVMRVLVFNVPSVAAAA